MLANLLHEIIDIMHGRGLMDAAKQADLKALVGKAVTAAQDTEKAAAEVAPMVPEAKTVEQLAADVARDGQLLEEHIPGAPAGA